MIINVWNLKSKAKVASNKISTKVDSIAVSFPRCLRLIGGEKNKFQQEQRCVNDSGRGGGGVATEALWQSILMTFSMLGHICFRIVLCVI